VSTITSPPDAHATEVDSYESSCRCEEIPGRDLQELSWRARCMRRRSDILGWRVLKRDRGGGYACREQGRSRLHALLGLAFVAGDLLDGYVGESASDTQFLTLHDNVAQVGRLCSLLGKSKVG
jgi:hypothetical protein